MENKFLNSTSTLRFEEEKLERQMGRKFKGDVNNKGGYEWDVI